MYSLIRVCSTESGRGVDGKFYIFISLFHGFQIHEHHHYSILILILERLPLSTLQHCDLGVLAWIC
jgi:hypothetical protein